MNLFSQGRFKADKNRHETDGYLHFPEPCRSKCISGIPPANQNKEKGADRARGERRVREAREIKSLGSGRKKFEFGSIEPHEIENSSVSSGFLYFVASGQDSKASAGTCRARQVARAWSGGASSDDEM